MLIRITQNKEGIEHYFETGQKSGRELSRDELDQRVHLSGDINAFAITTNYTRNNKKWDNHYWHITASFAIENNELDDDTLRAIHRDMLEYYFCAYDADKLVHAAEAHRPITQSLVDKSTGELKQRYLHLHSAISKYDTETGNQLRMIPFNLEADKSFQSHLCKKYGLVDPAERQRDIPVSKRDLIARWKGDHDVTKQTKVADTRKFLSSLLADVESLEQAKSLVLATGIANDVVLKTHKSGSTYLQVQTNIGTRNINLRGRGFEALDKFNNPSKTTGPRNVDDKWQEHKSWWLEQQEERKPARKINYEKATKKYESYYEKYTREQRRYFVVYRNNIQEESIRGYRIYEKNNERHLINNDLGVKIFDKPDRISLRIPDDADKRAKAVRLTLQIAQDKGWNLATLKVTGSFEFQQEVAKQVAEINASKPLIEPKPEPKLATPKPPFNAASQALQDNKQDQFKKLSAEQIKHIKTSLNASDVIELAVKKYGLLSDHFTVTNDNKIADNRTKAKPKNVIDFLTKTCNVPIQESMQLTHELYQQQLKKEDLNVDLSICTSKNPNALGGWQHKQPRTFTELASLVKSAPYAGFTKLKDNYRKAENITELGNVAIFDIDNDPDLPQLPLKDAQELLKDTTFMIVTSKSHQIEKQKPKGGTLPAVDRYRIIIPMNTKLTNDRDEYRLSMIDIAEKLGLYQYSDPKALKDIARQYYSSPIDAQIIVNNTKKPFDAQPSLAFGIEEKQRLEAEKLAAREQILNRSGKERNALLKDYADTPLTVDLDAINRLHLPTIYELMTKQETMMDGSYIMAKGVTTGTSQSRPSMTMFEANENWLWHDFKSGENGNVVTFMREAAGLNVFEAAKFLENAGVANKLITPNLEFYGKIVSKALETAKNDKDFECRISELTGANVIKLDGNLLQIADKSFKIEDFGYEKVDLINKFKINRSNNPSLKM
ncbi:TPA: LPD7 domain-containing protein [Photobacterium damselae]